MPYSTKEKRRAHERKYSGPAARDEARPAFEYLLNRMEFAAQADAPAEAGYHELRQAVLEHVATLTARVGELERNWEIDHAAAETLVDGNEVVYVGQSALPHSRIASHTRRGTIRFDRAFYLLFSKARVSEAEKEFIRQFRPRHNKAGLAA